MQIRNRVRELRMTPARELRPNPKNWRAHPARQQVALRGVLAEIGYAGALLARELPDGALELLDGHLRAETTPDAEVPVLVVDLNDTEADLLLATFDPLSALAEPDDDALRRLAGQLDCDNEQLRSLLDELVNDDASTAAMDEAPSVVSEPELKELFQVVVECDDEAAQRQVYERLTSEGFRCRLLML